MKIQQVNSCAQCRFGVRQSEYGRCTKLLSPDGERDRTMTHSEFNDSVQEDCPLEDYQELVKLRASQKAIREYLMHKEFHPMGRDIMAILVSGRASPDTLVSGEARQVWKTKTPDQVIESIVQGMLRVYQNGDSTKVPGPQTSMPSKRYTKEVDHG